MSRCFGVLCLALTAILPGCGRPQEAAVQPPPASRLSQPTPRDRYADDLGRFLAGLPAKPGSPLAHLESQQPWIEHRADSDRAWAHLEEGPAPLMRAFQQRELNQAPIAGATVFYPFSGPDVLMLSIFFPRSPAWVMVGLEPAGTLLSARELNHANLANYLARVRATVRSELNSSFFITRQMDRQFRGQVTDGLLLPILYLLVRTRHTVLGLRYVRLDEAGAIVERAADYHAPGKIGNKGVEIDFQNDRDGSVHKLFYFSVNLSDERLRQDPQFLRFLPALQGSVTFLKATSYMTHRAEFSMIREQVLQRSMAVLQDDTGIPYRFFTAPWQVQLYGSYVHPYGSFRWLEQKDLKDAYLTAGPKPLEFRIGYGYSRIPSNLLLARKSG